MKYECRPLNQLPSFHVRTEGYQVEPPRGSRELDEIEPPTKNQRIVNSHCTILGKRQHLQTYFWIQQLRNYTMSRRTLGWTGHAQCSYLVL